MKKTNEGKRNKRGASFYFEWGSTAVLALILAGMVAYLSVKPVDRTGTTPIPERVEKR